MKKTDYQVPCARVLEVLIQGSLLSNSVKQVESMNSVTGSWEEDDE